MSKSINCFLMCGSKYIYLFLFSLLIMSCGQHNSSEKVAKDWMQHGEWRNGLKDKPDSSIDALTFYAQYHKHQNWWDTAFSFINRNDLNTLAVGKYPLIGDTVFAAVSDYAPKDSDTVKWEAHKKYADIHFLIKGKEKIGEASAASLKEVVPYNEEKDLANLSGSGTYYLAEPGTFFIFFPGQAHRPGLKTDDQDTAVIKKVVIKVRIPK